MRLDKLLEKVDPTFWPRCTAYKYCDIDGEFMGFTDIYEHLAKIIPKDRIIVDLGCAYATQAVYFMKHKYDKNELFAICSYVPPWHDDNEKLVRENFRHCFVFYPTGRIG